VAALTLCAVIAGCGGNADDSAQSEGGRDGGKDLTEQQVINGLGLTTSDNGLTYQAPGGCEVAVVLNTPQEVALYSDAGDTVATNDGGTAGVKLVAQRASCTSALSQQLNDLGK
jgi:hypothetical protein